MSLRGYCRTFNVFIACNPAMRMTKLTTIASTGRLMKRSVNDVISLTIGHSEWSKAQSPNPVASRESYSTGPLDFDRDDIGSDFFRLSSFVIRASSFTSRIWRSRVEFRFRRKIVVHAYSHSVAQLKNAGAHNCFACFQALRNCDEIATCFADAHKLLPKSIRFIARLRVLLFLD